MSKPNVRRTTILERNKYSIKEHKDKKENKPSQNLAITKRLKRIYPIGIQRSNSSLSLSSSSSSSFSLSLSDNSNDSSFADFGLALRLIAPPRKRESPPPKRGTFQKGQDGNNPRELRRCNWITKNSDKVYVAFHDECWGVPVYDDNKLFELLAMCGMLMDYNWTEILKRRELFREAFCGFDPKEMAKMGDKEITEIASNKAIMLAETRVRCIVDNAKCILKIVSEYGTLSNYMWKYVNQRPVMNRYKYPKNVPIRSPKAEAISKDLLKRGFRFVGPVIVHSFMQAAGLTVDHLVDCYRHFDSLI